MVSDGTKSKYKSKLPLVIHQSIKAKIYDYYQDKKTNHFLLALGLYVFLYDTARHQNNIRVWATDTFIRKGTGIGQRLLPIIKKDLERMGLIEIYHTQDKNGVFHKRYIEVKYVWKPEAIDKLFYQEQNKTTEYKIAKALLVQNFNINEEIVPQEEFEFETEFNGYDVILSAESFFFNDDEVLVANTFINGEEKYFDYIVPSDRVGEIIMSLAGSYKFSLKGILYTLST